NNPQDFSEGQMSEIEELLDKLEDDEDVQAVFTNVN
ncbi:MAG: YebC/PmpR family DNA-binding transcriptional regulator, partial [Verrucomicrobiales bacterium]|nr:YebC/PmpR family DNA-binding transcriptional regulator [Verrucomicrobiales bacterium]